MQIYSQTIVEILILILAGSSLVFIPLYFNLHTVSLHILGPDWDKELLVIGGSMEPTLVQGDWICVSKVDASSVKVSPISGDIIVFQRPNSSFLTGPSIVSHRATDNRSRNGLTYFTTKGDGNIESDEWIDVRGENYTWNGMISELLLIGKVVGVRRSYAVEYPVGIMAIFMAGVIATDIAAYAYLIRKTGNQKTTNSQEI
jgi:signal peptidase I